MTNPTIVRLGGKRVLLSGKNEDGIYGIAFTRAEKPLLTRVDIDSATINPIVIIEFEDLDAMKVLLNMVTAMITHKKQPTWRLVRSYKDDNNE